MNEKKQRAEECFTLDSKSIRRGSDGSITVKGYLTKTGVFEYLRGDAKVRELRSAEEVFSDEALDSLRGARVTIDHPLAFLTTDNWKDLTVGNVSHVQAEPPYVAGQIRIWDERTASMVENGQLKEVSCGYACIPESIDSEDYSVSQTQIRYNHAALGPSGWGRLGSDVALRLDSTDNQILSPFNRTTMDEENEPTETVDAVEALTALLKEEIGKLTELIESKQTADSEKSPITPFEELPNEEAIEQIVRKRVDATLSLELRARDAHSAFFPKDYVEPELCGKLLCERVLQTVDRHRDILDTDDVHTLINEAELLAKKHRQDAAAKQTTKHTLSERFSQGVPAAALSTPRTNLRDKIYGAEGN